MSLRHLLRQTFISLDQAADVLGRADDTAGELAAALDQARAAGLACGRAYGALRAGG